MPSDAAEPFGCIITYPAAQFALADRGKKTPWNKNFFASKARDQTDEAAKLKENAGCLGSHAGLGERSITSDKFPLSTVTAESPLAPDSPAATIGP